jgi:hypothetical protein
LDENLHVHEQKAVAEQIDAVDWDPADEEYKADAEKKFLRSCHPQLFLNPQ